MWQGVAGLWWEVQVKCGGRELLGCDGEVQVKCGGRELLSCGGKGASKVR